MEAEKAENSESHITSAAAFVEGGIQDACDDACSICLEEFSESDPSTVTCCKHEFHLQCILEWCQRSSQCPMCWQAISLKDPTSQELLDAVERERKIRAAPARNATIFHHPTLGDFELQHLPLGVNDADLEERIIQHLAAAAAMGRAHHLSRREGQRGRLSSHGHPHFLVFSAHPSTPHPEAVSTSLGHLEDETELSVSAAANQPLLLTSMGDESSHQLPIQTDQVSSSAGSSIVPRQVAYFHNRSPGSCSSPIQDRAGPSEFQSFSESLKSKWNAVSTRYKESISKNTRGWKDRFFSRTPSAADPSSDGRREPAGGIDLSRVMVRLEINENHRESRTSESPNHAHNPVAHTPTIQRQVEHVGEYSVDEGNSSASVHTGSVSD